MKNRKKIAQHILLSLALFAVLLLTGDVWKNFVMPSTLSITVRSTRDDLYQVFFDTGKGYNQRDSVQSFVDRTREFIAVRFSLPGENIRNIRIDLGTKEGPVEIGSICLKSLLKSRCWTATDIYRKFRPLNDIAGFEVKNEVLHIESSGKDPFLEYASNLERHQTNRKHVWGIAGFISLVFFFIANFSQILANLFRQYVNRVNVSTTLVFGFAAFVLFFNLGGHYLEDWDEAWYVQMAQRAIEKGDYLVQEFRNEIFWEKSPFPVYPMILVFKTLGVTEATARLSSAFFGLGILVQVFVLARRFYGHWAALLAVLIAITSIQFVFSHGLKGADIESITLFFLIGSISCWMLIKRPDYKIILTIIALSFAFLCKGPIIIIPVLVILSTLLVRNQFREITFKPVLIGLSLGSLIVLPWYLYMYLNFGNMFIEQHFVRNILQRYNSGINIVTADANDMKYLENLLSPHNYIWFGLALISIIYSYKRYAEKKNIFDFLLLSWVFIGFLVTNQSQTKAFWYIYPIYIPLAIMSAKTLTDFVEERNYLNKTTYYVGLVAIATFLFGTKLFPHGSGSNIVKAAIAVLALLAVTAYFESCLPKYRNILAIGLVCLMVSFPIYQTAHRTLEQNMRPPVFSLTDGMNLPQFVNAYQLGPGALYYLHKKYDVREMYNPSHLNALKGQMVITRTEAMDGLLQQSARPIAPSPVGRTLYKIVPVKTFGEVSIFRVD